MKYTNVHNIPLPLAVFLATDHYDHTPNTISVTSLLRPTRQLVLSLRLSADERLTDVSDLVSSRMGSAIHTAIEQAWLSPQQALLDLGFHQKVIDRIKVNPTQPNPKDINVFMEKRSSKTIAGYTVTGKFDFVAENKVQDFKSTSVYTYLNQSNVEKYQLQGSMYRWLNPDIISADTMTIHYIFTDWNKAEALRNKDYPPKRVHAQHIPLLSVEQTEHWVRQKLTQIKRYQDTPEDQLPLCSDEELWRKPTVYKYYKDPTKTTRATKNFDDLAAASAYMADNQGKGVIKEVKGQVIACRYCPVFHLCSQKDTYLNSGELVV